MIYTPYEPAISEKSTPVLVAMKFSVMKLIDLAGLINISATNLFPSITAPVLLVVSHITWKSVTPRLPLTSLKNGSTILRKFALVNSSLNSNNCALAAVEIAFSSAMNNLRTLILSNAEGLLSRVLSPNNIIPCPGKETNGFTLPLYNVSLSALLGLYANLVTPNSCPRFTPAGENHASATV